MPVRIAFILLFFITKFSFGQELQSTLINTTQEQGLPSNETYCIIRDSKNYIWVSSDQGVVRLNGTTIKTIEGLPDNVVFKIREDKKGRIWFFSHTHKLSYFFQGKLFIFKYNDQIQEQLKSTLILDAFINENDQILINTPHFINFIIDINTGLIHEQDSNKKSDSDKLEIDIHRINDSFYFARARSYYRTTFSSLLINTRATSYEKSYTIPLQLQKRFQFYGSTMGSNKNIYFFAGYFVIKLFPDGSYKTIKFKKEILTINYNSHRQKLYVGLREGGLFLVNDDNLDLNMPFETLSEKSVTSIAFDNEGGEWFSTLENGIYYNKAQYVSKLVKSKVFRLSGYTDSILIYANREGLFQYKNGKSTQLINEQIKNVFDIKFDRDGDVIVTGEFEGLRYNNNYKTIFPVTLNGRKRKVYFVSASSDLYQETDTSYIFRHAASLFRYTKEHNGEYEASYFTSEDLPELGEIYIDNYKKIWFIGITRLYKFNVQKHKFVLFNIKGLPASGISGIQQFHNGEYAFGYRSGGIAILKEGKSIGTINSDKRINNAIKFMQPVGNQLWLVTANGISVIHFQSFDPLKYQVKNFGENAGLNTMVIYQLALFQNKIIIASSKGIYQLEDLVQQLADTPAQVPIYINSISYFKGDASNIKSISLPYIHNRLVVNFDAIAYNTPGGLEYYYRLLNADSTWYTINSGQLVLDELLPGNYTLQLKAGVPTQGRSSLVKTLSIIIEKPWWQKNAVIALFVLLFIISVYSFYLWRIKRIRVKERDKTLLREKLMDLEQTALRSQMNPHFIFNCLSSIQQLVLSDNKNEANDYLVKFARLIRKTLEMSSAPYISLAREKDYLTEYVEMEQLRLTNHFKFEFLINDDIDPNRVQLPNMMLQPVIENSIRHGIKSLKERIGVVSVAIEKTTGYLHCEITDNGIGRKTETSNSSIYTSHKSFGLNIATRRLEGLADAHNFFIKIIDLKDERGTNNGTKVILHLPYKIV